MDIIAAMRAFAAVVDAGGFAAAARDMGASRSQVNKQVAKLEERLGAQLLRRSTRSVTATEVGQAFYDRVQIVLGELDSAMASVRALQDTPVGRLRINAPMTFGTRQLSDLLNDYMSAYAEVHVEVVLNDRFVDPIEEGFDLSIRISEPRAQTSLIHREICRTERVLCAAPSYLAGHGAPATPAELSDHRCLHYGYQESGLQWRLQGPGGAESVPIRCAMWSNNGDVLQAAACAGQGIALLPTFIVGEALRRGELARVLPAYQLAPLTLQAIYPRHRHLSAKVRRFIELLEQRFGDTPPW
jgi:DNA-binding transcriptional LysR family regulator